MRATLTSITSGLTRFLEAAVMLGMLALTLDVLWGVCSRYVLGQQSAWTEPLATTLLVWVSLLGGALAYGSRAHLGVDYLVSLLAEDAHRLSAVLVQLLVLGFSAWVFMAGGWRLFADRLDSGQVVQGLLGLERAWVYLAIPICGLFICLYAINQLVDALCPVEGNTPPPGATL